MTYNKIIHHTKTWSHVSKVDSATCNEDSCAVEFQQKLSNKNIIAEIYRISVHNLWKFNECLLFRYYDFVITQ